MRPVPEQPVGGVWRCKGKGLGDCVCFIGFLYDRYQKTGEKQVLHTQFIGHGNKNRNCTSKLIELLAEFPEDVRNAIQLKDSLAPFENNPIYYDYFSQIEHVHPLSTIRWNVCKDSPHICYQFDGKSHGGKNMKGKEHEQVIIDSIKEAGYTPVQLGGKNSLHDCFVKLSTCSLFIGVDSGMAHMAVCADVPMAIIRNARTENQINELYPDAFFTMLSDYLAARKFILELKK